MNSVAVVGQEIRVGYGMEKIFGWLPVAHCILGGNLSLKSMKHSFFHWFFKLLTQHLVSIFLFVFVVDGFQFNSQVVAIEILSMQQQCFRLFLVFHRLWCNDSFRSGIAFCAEVQIRRIHETFNIHEAYVFSVKLYRQR